MSSTATTASTKTSPSRKRPISSSVRSSPSPPSAKRHGLVPTPSSRPSTNKQDRAMHPKTLTDHDTHAKHASRHVDNTSPSTDQPASRCLHTSDTIVTKRSHLCASNNSKVQAMIVKPSATADDDGPATQPTHEVLTKSISASVPIVKSAAVLSRKSLRADNVIIQQVDGNIHANPPTKLVKLVVPHTKNSSSSIKMLSSGDGLASALRIPTKIQLTKAPFASAAEQSCSSATNSLDTTDDRSENQSPVHDYTGSASLPPTPPPPVIDNAHSTVRNILSHASTSSAPHEAQHRQDEVAATNQKAMGETDDCPAHAHSNRSKREPLIASDWSVPPTSELSPASLASSSPDLTQSSASVDDSLVEHDASAHGKDHRRRSWSASCPVLPSSTAMSHPQSSSTVCLEAIESKSLTPHRKRPEMHHDQSSATSTALQLVSSQSSKKRRRAIEAEVQNRYSEKLYRSKAKQLKVEFHDVKIIKDLLAEIVERVVAVNNDNALKTLLNTSISQTKQIVAINRLTARPVSHFPPPFTNRKGSAKPKESRSMVMTPKELDDLAYLLFANVHRAEYERIVDPQEVEERIRSMWTQMNDPKKSTYYKRVLQIYKKPRRDITLASCAANSDKHSFSPTDPTDKVTPSTLPSNPLSVELQRQTSTPLSFHSLPSSSTDDQSSVSPASSTFRTSISADVVNELTKGANALDKLSCSPTAFVESIEAFARSTVPKQAETVAGLEQKLDKRCSAQLARATAFYTQKVRYFATKYQLGSCSESMNELTLIVKYFYLLVLSLNCQKQEKSIQQAIVSLLHGNLSFIDPSFCSSVLTSIIEDLILCSSLANDYLASQPLLISDVEHSLPFVRNTELENELLHAKESPPLSNPFSTVQELQDYLTHCENPSTNIPYYPPQQPHHPSMYYPSYPSSSQYYYPPSQATETNPYYYSASSSYSHGGPQAFPYGQPAAYYHSSGAYASDNGQFRYYYNPSQHPPLPNSMNDIPLSSGSSLHRSFSQMGATTHRTYSNSQQSAIANTVPRASIGPSQSNSMNASNRHYPP